MIVRFSLITALIIGTAACGGVDKEARVKAAFDEAGKQGIESLWKEVQVEMEHLNPVKIDVDTATMKPVESPNREYGGAVSFYIHLDPESLGRQVLPGYLSLYYADDEWVVTESSFGEVRAAYAHELEE